MGRAFAGLLASSLPATALFFLIGAVFLKKLRLTFNTLMLGFFMSWLIAAVFALLIADQPTVGSAMKSIVPSSLVGSILGLAGIGIAGKRKKD